MKKIIFAILLLSVFSCQKKEAKEIAPKKDTTSCSTKEKKFEMYQMSEMAALMEQMYAENAQVKKKLENGEKVGDFPEYYNKIFSSKFTDETDNDAFFKTQAKAYIDAQKAFYNLPSKETFNKGVTACIACHEQKCGGPIVRIKKLYIK